VKVEERAALDAGIGSEDERLMFEKSEAWEICAGEEGVRLAGLGGICAFDWCCECGGSCDGTDCAVGEGCVNGASVGVELVGLELEETCTGATPVLLAVVELLLLGATVLLEGVLFELLTALLLPLAVRFCG